MVWSFSVGLVQLSAETYIHTMEQTWISCVVHTNVQHLGKVLSEVDLLSTLITGSVSFYCNVHTCVFLF